MFASLNQIVGTLIWLGLLLPILFRGGRWERRLAWVLMLDLTAVELFPQRHRVNDPQWVMMAGDVVVLAFIVWVLVCSRRRWAPIAAGFQLVAVLAHVPRLVDPTIRNYGYLTLTTAAGYAVVLTLAVGAYLERRHAH